MAFCRSLPTPLRLFPLFALACSSVAGAGIQELWSARYNGPAPGLGFGRVVQVDPEGNVLVAAELDSPSAGRDLGVFKYAPDGHLLWSEQIGKGTLRGGNVYLAVDADSSIRVAGNFTGAGAPNVNSTDILVAAYDAGGRGLWTALHGTREDYDTVSALAVDREGGTIIAGSHQGLEWITNRYDQQGNLSWSASYGHGHGGVYSTATALAADPAGSVYVTGDLDGEIVTVKYSASGQQEWEARFGPGYPRAMGIDGRGDIYISGASRDTAGKAYYTALKYDASGRLVWSAIYPKQEGNSMVMAVYPEGGAALASSPLGSGITSPGDFHVLALAADGTLQWEAKRSSASGTTAIALDPQGNVLVTGWTQGSRLDILTVKYDRNGKQSWQALYDGPGSLEEVEQGASVAADREGNVYVTGGAFAAREQAVCTTVKYGPEGRRRWVAEASGFANLFDSARTVVADGEGNAFVAGSSSNGGPGVDFAAVKYRPDGSTAWSARYGGPGTWSWVSGALLDRGGHLIVGGAFGDSRDSRNRYLLVKFNPDGATRWVAQYGDELPGDHYATALAVDGEGNAYLTGVSYQQSLGRDFTTVKFNADGQQVWAVRTPDPGDADEPSAIAVDGAGFVYVAGTVGVRDRSSRFLTAKLDPEGREVWSARFGDEAGFAKATALALGPQGEVIVTGWAAIPTLGQQEFVTIRYTSGGSELWVARSGAGSIAGCCVARAMTLDATGNVYLTGGRLVRKYAAADGSLSWEVVIDNLDARSIALDAAGRVFVGGSFDTLESRVIFFVAQLDSDGNRVATASHAAPAGADYDLYYDLNSMAIDSAGDVILTGATSDRPNLPSDFLTVKFRPEGQPFIRGDANQDGQDDIADGITVIDFLFRGGPEPSCAKSADLDDDGRLDLNDALYCFRFQFEGGAPPLPPFPACALDTTLDFLACGSYVGCQ